MYLRVKFEKSSAFLTSKRVVVYTALALNVECVLCLPEDYRKSWLLDLTLKIDKQVDLSAILLSDDKQT